MAIKKAKRKLQHKQAIEGYKEWVEQHPKATHQQKFDQFDMFVDTSILAGEVNALQAAAA